MGNSVHKKKSELILWETSAPERRGEAGRRRTPEQRREPERRREPEQRIKSEQRRESEHRIKSEQSGTTQRRREPARRIEYIDAGRRSRSVRPDRSVEYISTQRRKRVLSEAERIRAEQRRKARIRRVYLCRILAGVMLISVLVLIVLFAGLIYRFVQERKVPDISPANSDDVVTDRILKENDKIAKPDIEVDLLNVNDYSRPGTEIEKVKNIFVHYTANPKTSAAQNRSYFANLEQTHERSASAHLIIGYEGEILQCIPLDEQAYAVMTRNADSISIECCYLDDDGEFTQETYDSLVHLLAWLVQEYKLDCTDILRHYDCGGKMCPLYYVEHEDKWEKLLADVAAYSG
ncbi:MAG: peptidoglycan recognition protein family protein [Butyrivibrio sp.]|nr:peptidoglycan recognition protein family protein [Butyrivibrio sp.]